MCKQAFFAALLFVSAAAFVQAQDSEMSLGPETDQSVVAGQTELEIEASQPVDNMMMSGAGAACGCQQSLAGCEAMGCQQMGSCACGQRMNWKQRCAYYRSVRNAFDRGPCCAETFGGFGPLWESYCFDKQNCCLQTCSPQKCRPRAWSLRRKPACTTCTSPAGDCSIGVPSSSLPIDIGQPPEPTESPVEPELETAPSDEVAPDLPPRLAPEAESAQRNLLNWPFPPKR